MNHNITRMDYGRTHAWWVRIYRGTGDQKRCVSALFSDQKHGGKRKALASARAWRDLQLKKLGPGLHGGSRVELGYGYVKRIDVVQRSGSVYPHWEAWIRVDHRKWVSTKRSIEKHGLVKAKRLCEAWIIRRRSKLKIEG